MKLIRFDEQFTARLSAIDETPWPTLRFIMLQDLRRLTEETLTSQQRTSYFIELNMRLGKVFRQWARKDTLPALDPELFIQACRQITDWPDTDTKLWLETAICLRLIRLGAIDKLIEFLREQYSVHIDQEEFPASPLQVAKWLDQLDGKIPAALLDQLRKYEDLPQFKSSHRTVNGLFVLQSGEYSVGAIAEISLEKVTVSDKLAIDQVRIATHLVDESDVISQQTRAVCIYLREKYHKRNEGRLRLEYSLNQPSSLLVGGSAGLAFALLGQMGLYAYQHNHTFEPRVYQDVAFTGTIDEKGNVLPVSASSFKDKIEAAFFGNIRTVIIPQSQGKIVKKVLADLGKSYPNRPLNIIAISTMDELSNHREVLHYQRRKVASRLNQFVHDYANSVTLMILGFVVLAAAGFWFGVVKNSVPVAIKDVEINHIHHAEVKN
ncbi:MAG: S16 family serine protease [Fidelibacterota bacterium]